MITLTSGMIVRTDHIMCFYSEQDDYERFIGAESSMRVRLNLPVDCWCNPGRSDATFEELMVQTQEEYFRVCTQFGITDKPVAINKRHVVGLHQDHLNNWSVLLTNGSLVFVSDSLEDLQRKFMEPKL